MALRDNIFYWKYSCNNPEDILDSFYIRSRTIITDEELIKAISKLRVYLSVCCLILQKNLPLDKETKKKILDICLIKIDELLETTKNIQYTEFVAFWKTLDISYSIFSSRFLIEFFGREYRKKVLYEIIEYYCKERKNLYDKEGYSNIVIQALYDDGTSKRQSNAGINKLESIIKKIFPTIQQVFRLTDLKTLKYAYYIVDKNKEGVRNNKELCNIIRKELSIAYKFGDRYNYKVPDIIIKINNDIFIIEAKHIKELGGGQNKQILELIEFIKYGESNAKIHYVSFLDGLYFNFFAKIEKEIKKKSPDVKSKRNITKLLKEYEDIKENLGKQKNNFFVNTAGFKQLMKDAK